MTAQAPQPAAHDQPASRTFSQAHPHVSAPLQTSEAPAPPWEASQLLS